LPSVPGSAPFVLTLSRHWAHSWRPTRLAKSLDCGLHPLSQLCRPCVHRHRPRGVPPTARNPLGGRPDPQPGLVRPLPDRRKLVGPQFTQLGQPQRLRVEPARLVLAGLEHPPPPRAGGASVMVAGHQLGPKHRPAPLQLGLREPIQRRRPYLKRQQHVGPRTTPTRHRTATPPRDRLP
jgi:hypothetical protein